jgi:hypothetical protein
MVYQRGRFTPMSGHPDQRDPRLHELQKLRQDGAHSGRYAGRLDASCGLEKLLSPGDLIAADPLVPASGLVPARPLIPAEAPLPAACLILPLELVPALLLRQGASADGQ